MTMKTAPRQQTTNIQQMAVVPTSHLDWEECLLVQQAKVVALVEVPAKREEIFVLKCVLSKRMQRPIK